MPAIGTSPTIITYHERLGERTIQNRIDQSLDTMRPPDARSPRFCLSAAEQAARLSQRRWGY